MSPVPAQSSAGLTAESGIVGENPEWTVSPVEKEPDGQSETTTTKCVDAVDAGTPQLSGALLYRPSVPCASGGLVIRHAARATDLASHMTCERRRTPDTVTSDVARGSLRHELAEALPCSHDGQGASLARGLVVDHRAGTCPPLGREAYDVRVHRIRRDDLEIDRILSYQHDTRSWYVASKTQRLN